MAGGSAVASTGSATWVEAALARRLQRLPLGHVRVEIGEHEARRHAARARQLVGEQRRRPARARGEIEDLVHARRLDEAAERGDQLLQVPPPPLRPRERLHDGVAQRLRRPRGVVELEELKPGQVHRRAVTGGEAGGSRASVHRVQLLQRRDDLRSRGRGSLLLLLLRLDLRSRLPEVDVLGRRHRPPPSRAR